MCVQKWSHISLIVLQLSTELIALPPITIGIKCYDIEAPMSSSGYCVS
jgi:hypothetical protein